MIKAWQRRESMYVAYLTFFKPKSCSYLYSVVIGETIRIDKVLDTNIIVSIYIGSYRLLMLRTAWIPYILYNKLYWQ
jgi:hypothetical protein